MNKGNVVSEVAKVTCSKAAAEKAVNVILIVE